MNEKRDPERRTWRLEGLRGADLRGQDLTVFKGLLPEHLAGADLTGARLHEEIARFPALDQVAAISGESRKIFIGLLAACVYSWLVIATTEDVQLIVNTATSPLPIINTPIPIAGFYVVGAFLLAAIYCWLHLYLHHLWRTLATLPAVFPDGTSLDDKSDPWLLSNFVRAYSERLNSNLHPLTRLEIPLSILLTWCLVPLTLFALWGRYLPRHGWFGTFLLGVLTGFTVFFGWHTFRFARATLCGEAPPPVRVGLARSWREFRALGWVGRMFMLLVALTPVALIVCSLGAFWVDPRNPDSWMGKGLNALKFVGIRTYADLREVNVAEPPDAWDGKDWDKVKQVDLEGRNLSFADASGAFLVNANLRGANLAGADLSFAQLEGTDLRGAEIRGTKLWETQLQDASLRAAQLQGADLRSAQLQGADLRFAQLQGADLSFAQLEGADLSFAELQGADLTSTHLQGADLTAASLQGADLSFAQLQGTRLAGAQLQGVYLQVWGSFWSIARAERQTGELLSPRPPGSVPLANRMPFSETESNFQGADFRSAALWRASLSNAHWDFADLIGAHVFPMTPPAIDALISDATKSIPDEARRKAVTEMLNRGLRSEDRPSRPFPRSGNRSPM